MIRGHSIATFPRWRDVLISSRVVKVCTYFPWLAHAVSRTYTPPAARGWTESIYDRKMIDSPSYRPDRIGD